MAWMCFADGNGNGWNVEPDRAAQILYNRAFARVRNGRARREVDENGIFPDTVRIEVDYRGIRGPVRHRANRDYNRFWNLLQGNGAEAYRMLVNARVDVLRKNRFFERRVRRASRETSRNIDRAVRNGQAGAAVARTVRDFSATTLVIGSAFISGGASLTVLGGGSLMSGVGTYEDTGNVGAALIKTSTTFTMGLIPITRAAMVGRAASGAAALTQGEKAALFIIGVGNNVSSDTLTSLVSGKDAKRAITDAIVNAGLGAVTNHLTDGFFEKLTLPSRAMLEAARDSARGAVAGYATDQVFAQPLPAANGSASAAFASLATRNQTRQLAENFVQLYAMSAERANVLRAMSGRELLQALRQSQ